MDRTFVAMSLLVASMACKTPPPPPHTHHAGSAAVTDSAQSPAWVVDQFFGWTTFPAAAKYMTDAFAKAYGNNPTPGAQTPANATVVSRQLARTDASAVFATTVRGPPGVQELYTYLDTENGVWKISSVRSLGFGVGFHMVIDSLKKGGRVANAPPRLVSRLELAVSGDSEVKRYFLTHAQPIGAIAQEFRAQTAVAIVDVGDSLSRAERAGKVANAPHAHLRSLLDAVDVASVFKADKYPGCTFIRIGGVAAQQVGYFYAPKGCAAPVMSADRFIFIERIGPDWYEYRAL